jgi:TPR repeat protein
MFGLSNYARIMETLGTFAFAFHLRWTIVPVLLVMVPLVFLGRDRLLRQLLLGAQSVQQIALTQSHNAGVSAEQHKTVTRNHETNLTESAGEGNQEQNPQPESVLGLLQAARSGDPNAQFQLGTAYLRGRGLPPDTVTAYTWLTVAFANGNKQAESLIRELTRTLNSTEIACIRWNLGEMYAGGIGVRPDKVTAYMWHLLAEFSGESRSRVALSELDRSMTADEKSEAKSRASEWLRKHRLHQHATLPAT